MIELLKSPEIIATALWGIVLGGIGIVGWLIRLEKWMTRFEARIDRQEERDGASMDMQDKILSKVDEVHTYQVRQNGAVALKIEQESNAIRKDFRSEMQSVHVRIDSLSKGG